MLHNNQISQQLDLTLYNYERYRVNHNWIALQILEMTIFIHATLNISLIGNMKYKKVTPKLWRHDMMT